GVQVTDLVGGGVGVAGRLVRTAPPEKIKCDDSARRRNVREQTVVEVHVVREPMDQNDRRIRPRIVADVDPVSIPLHKRLLVDPHALRPEWPRKNPCSPCAARGPRPPVNWMRGASLLRPGLRLYWGLRRGSVADTILALPARHATWPERRRPCPW